MGDTIRRALTSDLHSVRELTNAAYAKWVPVIGRKPKPMTSDHANAIVEHSVDLFLRDGEAIGLIEMIQRPDHFLIESIAIDTAWQSQGIGSILLAHAESLAASSACAEVRLYTNAAFVANIQFYQKRGYCLTERELLPDGGVMVHMAKSLTATPY